MGRKRDRKRKLFYLYLAVIVIAIQFLSGCTTLRWVLEGKQELDDAKQMALHGDQDAAVKKYAQIVSDYPEMGDQALFRTAILYAQPKAGKSDYQKSLDVFQTMLERYPQSSLKEEAGVMVALIKELRKAQQQTDAWEKKAETLKQRIEKMKKIDQDIELKKRRLRPVR